MARGHISRSQAGSAASSHSLLWELVPCPCSRSALARVQTARRQLGWDKGLWGSPGWLGLCLPTVGPARTMTALAAPAPLAGCLTCLPRCHPGPSPSPRWAGHSCCSPTAWKHHESCENQMHLILSSHLLSLAYYRRDWTSRVSLSAAKKSPLRTVLPEKQNWKKKKKKQMHTD